MKSMAKFASLLTMCLLLACLASPAYSADASSDCDVGWQVEQAIDQTSDITTTANLHMEVSQPEFLTVRNCNCPATQPIALDATLWTIEQDQKPNNLYRQEVYRIPLRC